MLAIIGGSGLYTADNLFETRRLEKQETPFGITSSEILSGKYQDLDLFFLARHGISHQIAPHQINYRANIYALKQLGVTHIISVNAVGGIPTEFAPETIAIPDQIIDYTWGRQHSFSDINSGKVQHIDFTEPYSEKLRNLIISSAQRQAINVVPYGTYGCTNGPRLESKAEISRFGKDGCHIIGMTGMPEAALARELSIEYASIALVVNWCAGIGASKITMQQINESINKGMVTVRQLIIASLAGWC